MILKSMYIWFYYNSNEAAYYVIALKLWQPWRNTIVYSGMYWVSYWVQFLVIWVRVKYCPMFFSVLCQCGNTFSWFWCYTTVSSKWKPFQKYTRDDFGVTTPWAKQKTFQIYTRHMHKRWRETRKLKCTFIEEYI